MMPAFSEAVKVAAIDRAEELFRLAWGEPHKTAKRQWRARDSSARAMWMQGPKRGKWHDFKSGAGGDILEFVAVEFCGLSSARDDFPSRLARAADASPGRGLGYFRPCSGREKEPRGGSTVDF